MTYQVHLDTFHGPLDLLLYLVKKEEVDVTELPLSLVADQFLEHLKVMSELDVEGAGDFLVMAATLMEIKSRSLVPTEAEAEEADLGPDPRKELVRQLLEYRKFKDAARLLEEKAEGHATKLARQPVDEATRSEPVVRPVELWDLVSAFARFLRETQASRPQSVVQDDTPQHVYEEYIRQRLRAELRVSFIDLFTPPHHRSRLVGLFLAALELIRRFEVWVEQPEAFGGIWLSVPK